MTVRELSTGVLCWSAFALTAALPVISPAAAGASTPSGSTVRTGDSGVPAFANNEETIPVGFALGGVAAACVAIGGARATHRRLTSPKRGQDAR